MKIAFATLSMGVYPVRTGGKLDPVTRERLFAWGSKAGFDGIELQDSAFGCTDMSDAELEAMAKQLRDCKLKPAAVKVGGDLYTQSIAAKNEERMIKATHAAAVLGSSMVSTSIATPLNLIGVPRTERLGRKVSAASSAQAEEEDYVTTAAALRRVAEAAQKEGVQVSLEMHTNSLADNSKGTLKLHQMVNHPALGVNPDVGNLIWGYMEPEEDWRDCIATMAPYTNYWHLKNIYRFHIPELDRTVFKRGPLWEGVVDFRFAFAMMLRAGYNGWGVIEGAESGDHQTYVKQGLRYIREMEEEMEPFLK
jgi:sugar phosphate isomerase/epimerase